MSSPDTENRTTLSDASDSPVSDAGENGCPPSGDPEIVQRAQVAVSEAPRLGPVVATIQQRALRARDEEVNSFVPDPTDIEIAQGLMAGCLNNRALARALNLSDSAISQRLKDPVRAAWLSREITHAVRQSIGLVHASMLTRALAGNVSAAKLLLERFDNLAQKHAHVHLHGNLDTTKLSDDELRRILESKGVSPAPPQDP